MSDSTAALLQRGVIVEFDFAVLPGHSLLLESCRERLLKDGIKMNAEALARLMGGRTFSSGLNVLCTKLKKKVDVPDVIATCYGTFDTALKQALSQPLPSGFIDFIKALLAKGVKVVVVSRVESEDVKAMLTGIHNSKFVVMQDASAGFGFYSWDGWRRAARKNELNERFCVGVAGSGHSVKGALFSGMGVLVKSNSLVDYQDFSGCDVSFKTFTSTLADDAARILRV